eukprot:scaffold19699_cov29-Tisochrysis_lutea.AAC.1
METVAFADASRASRASDDDEGSEVGSGMCSGTGSVSGDGSEIGGLWMSATTTKPMRADNSTSCGRCTSRIRNCQPGVRRTSGMHQQVISSSAEQQQAMIPHIARSVCAARKKRANGVIAPHPWCCGRASGAGRGGPDWDGAGWGRPE